MKNKIGSCPELMEAILEIGLVPLLDSGIVGLILYLALLALSAAALWRGRKQDSPYRRLHPAL